MKPAPKFRLVEVLKKHESSLIADWVNEQLSASSQSGSISREELKQQCTEFFTLFCEVLENEELTNVRNSPAFESLRQLLTSVSTSRGLQGFSPSETAKFVFSLKKPLFERLSTELSASPDVLYKETNAISSVLDDLGLYTTEAHQKAREGVISRQSQELLELSTPVVKLWDGILALPLIGTLDSARTQVVMESLLQKIVETGSETAIIDITGVPTVDTLVAQHLLKTVTAARLMGADCIISGIRPQIAQTIVHLGVELGDVVTKASLAEAFKLAIRRNGLAVTKMATNRPSA